MAKDLDEDVDGLALSCLSLLKYHEAKVAFDSSKSEEDLKPWKNSRMMEFVTRNTFDIAKERRAKRAAAAEG